MVNTLNFENILDYYLAVRRLASSIWWLFLTSFVLVVF